MIGKWAKKTDSNWISMMIKMMMMMIWALMTLMIIIIISQIDITILSLFFCPTMSINQQSQSLSFYSVNNQCLCICVWNGWNWFESIRVFFLIYDNQNNDFNDNYYHYDCTVIVKKFVYVSQFSSSSTIIMIIKITKKTRTTLLNQHSYRHTNTYISN